jgi:hypothetical protein
MRVVVQVHGLGHSSFEAWWQHVARSPTGGPAMADLLSREIRGELERTHGQPAGAVENPQTTPSIWSWRFSGDTIVHYVMRQEGSRWLGGVTLRIMIIDVEFNPSA